MAAAPKATGTPGRSGRAVSRGRRNRGVALEHAQHVAALGARRHVQLVHEPPHEEDAPAAGAQLAGVEPRDGVEVERRPLVRKAELEGSWGDAALDDEELAGVVAVGVADDVVRGLV